MMKDIHVLNVSTGLYDTKTRLTYFISYFVCVYFQQILRPNRRHFRMFYYLLELEF